jgi:tetratricopeptide (TPR) repeat protein
MDNIRAAWRYAVQTGDVRGLVRAAHSLWLYFEMTDRYSEGASMMDAGFQALQSMTDIPAELEADYKFALARLRSRQAALNFRLVGAGILQLQLQDAVTLLRSIDQPEELGLLLNFMACGSHILGDHDQEEVYLRESIEHFERAGHRWGVAYSKNDLGQLWSLRGEFLSARELQQTALSILEELGDHRGVAFALRNLGIVERHLGHTDRALELLRRSVDARRPIGNQWGIAESLKQIGLVLRDCGDTDAATDHLREALQIAYDIQAMQLASEILGEYLPLVPEAAGSFTASSAVGDSTGGERFMNEVDVESISYLIESVLDADAVADQDAAADQA